MTRGQRIVAWIAALIAAGILIHLLNNILLPFVVGITIAYFFDPLADRLERLGLSRTFATSIIILGFFALSISVLILLFPTLQRQVSSAINLVPALIDNIQGLLAPILHQVQSDLTPEMLSEIKSAAGNYAGTMVKWVSGFIGNLLSGGLAILNLLSLILITPLVAFYLLRDWDDIVERIDGWLPRDAAPTIREQVKKIDATLAGFVRGQACVCGALAMFYAIGLTAAGLKAGMLIGIASGLLAVIPYVGATVGLLVGLGMAIAQFHQDWVSILIVAGVFFVGQMLESYVLTPRLVGGQVGLSPIWIIFAMLAGGALFGFTGVLIALPAAAVTGVLVRFGIERYLDSDLYRGAHDNGPTEKS